MKNTSALLVIIFSYSVSTAQEYYVLQVKGNVRRYNSGVQLKTGDKIQRNDKLVFSSVNDVVAIVSSKAGRFVLKPINTDTGNEFVSLVDDVLHRASARLSSRAGVFNNTLDFKVYFNDTILCLPKLIYKVNTRVFPINQNSFFFVRYRYHDEEINKQLPIETDSVIIINHDQLLSVDGKPIASAEVSALKLFYYDGTREQYITDLKVNFAKPENIKEQCILLYEVFRHHHNRKHIVGEIAGYLSENFGKVNEESLIYFLDSQ